MKKKASTSYFKHQRKKYKLRQMSNSGKGGEEGEGEEDSKYSINI